VDGNLAGRRLKVAFTGQSAGAGSDDRKELVYTLSSPTVLATDAATRPEPLPALRALSTAFRITPDGAFALAQAFHECDSQTLSLAWDQLELLTLTTPSMPDALRAAARGTGLPDPDLLAGIRFGNALDIASLVAREAADWPDGTAATVPGVGRVPASAAAAAGWTAATWVDGELEPLHVEELRAPFARAVPLGMMDAESASDLYGPRGEAVLDLLESLRAGSITAAALSSVSWPAGVWSNAMHQAAWACMHEGRLRAQMRAVLDVTCEFLRSNPGLTPARVRGCLPALHAMAVGRLVADVLEGPALGELALADFTL
jgi:hypothetical protein